MTRWCALALLLLAPLCRADCPPPDHPRAELETLKAAEFVLPDNEARQRLALALLACLGDPDPALRDGIAFEAFYTWLRADQLSAVTRAQLRDRLVAWVGPEGHGPAGFRQPFAALVLAEIVRTDRIAAWLTPAEREAIVAAAAEFLSGVQDHRGFIDGEGWRHGVAHGADLVLQLAVNPHTDKAQLDRLLAAVARQVAPADGHAYIHGESPRLALAVIYVALRGLHTPEEWQGWFTALAAPAPLASWREALGSEAGLARRHNTAAFLLALRVTAQDSEQAALQPLLPIVRDALKTLP